MSFKRWRTVTSSHSLPAIKVLLMKKSNQRNWSISSPFCRSFPRENLLQFITWALHLGLLKSSYRFGVRATLYPFTSDKQQMSLLVNILASCLDPLISMTIVFKSQIQSSLWFSITVAQIHPLLNFLGWIHILLISRKDFSTYLDSSSERSHAPLPSNLLEKRIRIKAPLEKHKKTWSSLTPFLAQTWSAASHCLTFED